MSSSNKENEANVRHDARDSSLAGLGDSEKGNERGPTGIVVSRGSLASPGLLLAQENPRTAEAPTEALATEASEVEILDCDGVTPGAATSRDHNAAPASTASVEEAARAAALAMAKQRKEEEKSWKKTQKELDDMFEKQSKQKFDSCPDFVMPPGFKDGVELLDYQKDGVRWLVQQEKDVENRIGPFWRQKTLGSISQNKWWYCSVNNHYQRERPMPDRGSILADEMGLGKTITTIALLIHPDTQPREHEPRCNIIVAPVAVIGSWKMQIEKFVKPGGLKVEIYHGPDREKLLGKVRRGQVDVLLTSYETIVSDFVKYTELQNEKEELKQEKARNKGKKKKARRDELQDAWTGGGDDEEDDWSPSSEEEDDEDEHNLPDFITNKRKSHAKRTPLAWIFDIRFHRIVLDEAHKIRNANTVFYKSVTEIRAEHKLCISGTIYVNKMEDIRSILCFLASGKSTSNPLVDKNVFKEKIINPISEAKEIGLARVRAIMSHLALRRTKVSLGENALALPSKEIVIRPVEFAETGKHFEVHDLLYKSARTAFIQMLELADNGCKEIYKNFYQFFALVTRVRQSCCHAGLIPQDAVDRAMAFQEHLDEAGGTDVVLDELEAKALLDKLLKAIHGAQNDEEKGRDVIEECAVCFVQLDENCAVVLRTCMHVLCEECFDKIASKTCPLCRTAYNSRDKIKKSVAEEAAKKKKQNHKKLAAEIQRVDNDGEQAPKVIALVEEIKNMNPDEKGVIFSQWTSYLDLIQKTLEKEGHIVTRIDGSMSAIERMEAMEAFDSDDDGSPRFILCSLLACGTGITLTRGNICFMMDLWWNYAAEAQAFDRIHRIGQTREVKIVRFVMKDSIEERFITLQDAKAALGKGSLQKLTKEERQKARITALKDLFQVNNVAKKWKGHYDDEDEHEDENESSDLGGFIVDDDDFD